MSRLDRPGRIRTLEDASTNVRRGRRPRILRAIRQLVDQGEATRGGLAGRFRGPVQ